ncbi:ProQ/FINO family protein [Thiothrix fructosivorans]|uniref:Fertility inhibition FinO n=1 Tax=Thiothrix fructosivorans TaxID=111770 RepID=A0A8B0SL70_9GAMM|nr:ProQ/FINO family protein [Thiothrix fructosivorans]MBO0611423.1 Fertility inhibition FinO [Thiothrix fructosivorans]QTX13013.1 Fertility inhibition FinO [Thiothrix fructosivorans]
MTDKPRKTLSLTRKTDKPEGTPSSVIKTVAGKRIIRREASATPSPPRNKPVKGKAPRKKPAAPKKVVTPPSTIREQELDQQLNGHFGAWRDHLPLAVGIEKAIFRYISENHVSASKRVVQQLLLHHTSTIQYLNNIMQQPMRYNLDGSPSGEIIPAEREYASQKLTSLPPANTSGL